MESSLDPQDAARRTGVTLMCCHLSRELSGLLPSTRSPIGRPSRAAAVKGVGLFSGELTRLATMPVRKMLAGGEALLLAVTSTMAG